MKKMFMICGVDCHTGDAQCNGYCMNKSDNPPAATQVQQLEAARVIAHKATDAAERAWHAYAAELDVGPSRTRAFEIYETLRTARRI